MIQNNLLLTLTVDNVQSKVDGQCVCHEFPGMIRESCDTYKLITNLFKMNCFCDEIDFNNGLVHVTMLTRMQATT